MGTLGLCTLSTISIGLRVVGSDEYVVNPRLPAQAGPLCGSELRAIIRPHSSRQAKTCYPPRQEMLHKGGCFHILEGNGLHPPR
jgi:hypothetical protein